ncbi:hypothetical protein EMIHUDRAFT_456636 [Emiliania huxleyi CCMP1516]|uniref:Uncharacterized protein n=2 Tax=Emiliania huxleyi TaxID=2903 RepID=A0A0D3K3F4_EMIH1|nr:hypothetical protein EMIHUDRAFT_456636 [Emiliania huxleyi CCMP1516]EOD30289.1 hypothetical protein EMIHUDRAFT_456636 [Emiliania huxleyi CCMP1516]|mmetsp:Transcript_36494/g.116946  ORF Transcript_36494/g.116946 Transcript_36494/m.116946 type:complete len:138 (+) Transcript_36494:49-462(+)|eukprot:XP_005782718.1 hypothetical protein EMIHUDRAFT_456636 [Emiliania huxleyi CCMP1516]
MEQRQRQQQWEVEQRRQQQQLEEVVEEELLEEVSDACLSSLIHRSSSPAIVLFSDGSRGSALLEGMFIESSRRSGGLRVVKAPISSCGRLWQWTRSQGQPLQSLPVCVLFVRGSPVATLAAGDFTPELLMKWSYLAG